MDRIGIDAGFVLRGRVGGAEHMLVNLVQGLRETGDDELVVFCDDPWPVPAGPALRWIPLEGRGNRFVRTRRAVRKHARRLDAMLFANYYTPPFIGSRRPRIVTVIHDLQYLHHPKNFSGGKRVWLRAAHETSLRLADAVVAISDSVREDVLQRYGERWATKVHSIPNPVSLRRFEADGLVDPGLPPGTDRYVLSVAAQYPHKNLGTLIEAFALVRGRPEHSDVRLVLAGQLGERLSGIAWHPRIEETIERLGLADAVHLTGYVSDEVLGELYRRAAVFAFPSLFEGFGLPAVEALGLGLPVLTTRRTSIPQATLGLATYVDDPLDADEMASRLGEMLADPGAHRPSPEAVGRIRGEYDPARVARRYRELLLPGRGASEREGGGVG